MAKPRRNVQFQHRSPNGHDGRRPSVSEISEGASEPGSPTRANGKDKSNHEKVPESPSLCLADNIDSSILKLLLFQKG